MPQFSPLMRWSLALLLLAAGCGRSPQEEIALSAAPVRHVAAKLSQSGKWIPGRCLCVGHFREDAVEDFPAGVLDADYAAHPFLRKWSDCAPYYGRAKSLKGCEEGMTDFICSVSEQAGASGAARVLCHINGESEAMQKEGYLQDDYDVTKKDGGYEVHPVNVKGSAKIHE